MKSLTQAVTEGFEEYLFEGVAEKDWMRMADLYLNDKDGAGVAKSIKDKNKAIARYVTGLKISGDKGIPEDGFRNSTSLYDDETFAAFYNKAVELGATKEEIAAEFKKLGDIPVKISEKISIFAAKNMRSWITGDLSKAVHKAGFDMTLSKGGNAKTTEGKDAMSRSGAKWTIGYVATVKTDNVTKTLEFDAITDEGVDNNTIRYVWNSDTSLNDRDILTNYRAYNKTTFIKQFIDELTSK